MRLFKSFVLIILLSSIIEINVNAEEKFDGQFYGSMYPDVVAVYGSDESALYDHYVTYGKYEGRLAYDGDVPDVVIPIEQSGTIDRAVLNTIEEQLELVPGNIRSSFVNNKWRIVATDEDISKTEFGGAYKSIRGATLFDKSTIKIHNRLIAAKTATCHEFGHYLYSVAGRFDDSKEVEDAYQSEKDNKGKPTSGGNGLSSAIEFYAEVFYIYCSDKDYAVRYYPIMCSILEKDISSVK